MSEFITDNEEAAAVEHQRDFSIHPIVGLKLRRAVTHVLAFPEGGGEETLTEADWEHFATTLYDADFQPVGNYQRPGDAPSHSSAECLNAVEGVILHHDYSPGKFRGVLLRELGEQLLRVYFGMLGHDEKGYYLLIKGERFYVQPRDGLYAQDTEHDPDGPWGAPPDSQSDESDAVESGWLIAA